MAEMLLTRAIGLSRAPIIAWRISGTGRVDAVTLVGVIKNVDYQGRLAIRSPDGRCRPTGLKRCFKDDDAWHEYATENILERAWRTQKAVDESVDEDFDEVVD
jgi:hypothetical protein